MPRLPKFPFACCRCGYTATIKDYMRRHLYNLKKPCLSIVNDIELTEDIKQAILTHRKYNVPEPAPAPAPVAVVEKPQVVIQTFNQQLNYYNQIYNNLVGMDTQTKLRQLMEYENKEISNFEDTVEQRLAHKKRDLNRSKERRHAPILHAYEDLYEIVHGVMRVQQNKMEEYNVMFEEDESRIAFHLGDWESNQLDKGLSFLIDTITSNYYDYYEAYLIQRLQTCFATDKASMHDSLEVYYRFLSVFNVPPFVRGKQDSDIFENGTESADETDIESHRLVDRYNALYETCKESMTNTDKRNIKREIINIIKRSTRTNTKDLNNYIIDVIKLDKDYMKRLLMPMA